MTEMTTGMMIVTMMTMTEMMIVTMMTMTEMTTGMMIGR